MKKKIPILGSWMSWCSSLIVFSAVQTGSGLASTVCLVSIGSTACCPFDFAFSGTGCAASGRCCCCRCCSRSWCCWCRRPRCSCSRKRRSRSRWSLLLLETKVESSEKNRSRSDLFTNFPSHYCKVCIPDQIFLEPQTISEPLKARRSIDVKALK